MSSSSDRGGVFSSFKDLKVLKQPLKTVAQCDNQKNCSNFEKARQVLQQLKKAYPLVFNIKKPLPLAVGISKEIVKNCPELTGPILRLALAIWTKKEGYLQAVIASSARYNLDGSVASSIQESEKEYSQKMLERKQEKLKNKAAENYYVYILECSNGAFYTGWTNDLEKRYRDHCEGNGAKYTRSFKPVKIAQQWQFGSKSMAMQAEAQIKKVTLKEKKKIIADPALLVLENNIK